MTRISNSAEMQRWDVPGDYSRPICRRIVEEAGVDRGAFGTVKKAASVMFHTSEHFLTRPSAEDYLHWLSRNRSEWIRRGRVPPLRNLVVDHWIQMSRDYLYAKTHDKPFVWRLSARFADSPTRLRKYVFPWAIEHARSNYPGSASLEIANT
jgi:hypothetical protein